VRVLVLDDKLLALNAELRRAARLRRVVTEEGIPESSEDDPAEADAPRPSESNLVTNAVNARRSSSSLTRS
jgi:hypothetical protein